MHDRSLKSGLDVSDPALAPAFTALREERSSVGWVLYTYGSAAGAGGNVGKPAGSKIGLACTGQGLDGLIQVLQGEEEGKRHVYFGALRVRRKREQQQEEQEGRCKCLSFLWVGPEVGGVARGKAVLHKNGVVQGLMEGGVVGELKVDVDEEEGWTKEGIEAAARKAVGVGSGRKEEEEWVVVGE